MKSYHLKPTAVCSSDGGDKQSADVVLRALSLFEQPNISITDYEVYQILAHQIGKTKVRQGRGSTYVKWTRGLWRYADRIYRHDV